MGFPSCKLIGLTGPVGFATNVALGYVSQPPGGPEGPPIQVKKLTLDAPTDGSQRTSFWFDDDVFVPFSRPDQLKFVLNALGGGAPLGDTLAIGTPLNVEATARFTPMGIQGPYWELTYKVLPD